MLQSRIQNHILMGRTEKPVNKKCQAQTLAQDKIFGYGYPQLKLTRSKYSKTLLHFKDNGIAKEF